MKPAKHAPKPAITEFKIKEVPATVNICGMKEHFGIGQYTTYELIKNGEVKASKIGRDWIIKSRSVLDLIDRREAGVTKTSEVSI